MATRTAANDSGLRLLALLLGIGACAANAELLIHSAVAAAAAADGQQDFVRARFPSSPMVLQLPGGTKPEGLCSGPAGSFFVTGLNGRVLWLERASGRSVVVADEGAGALLTGCKYDAQSRRLYVAGGPACRAYAYAIDADAPARVVGRHVLHLAAPGGYINDVALGNSSVWFSDSLHPALYSIPRAYEGASPGTITRHPLTPRARFTGSPPLQEAANGLAEASPGAVVFAHYHAGQLYRLDTRQQQQPAQQLEAGVGRHATPASAPQLLRLPVIDGKRVMPDGLWFSDASTLWVADNFNNRLLKLHVSEGAATARLACVVTAPPGVFNTPTTLTTTADDGMLWAVNAHFLDCPFFLPCTWQRYEVVGARLDALC